MSLLGNGTLANIDRPYYGGGGGGGGSVVSTITSTLAVDTIAPLPPAIGIQFDAPVVNMDNSLVFISSLTTANTGGVLDMGASLNWANNLGKLTGVSSIAGGGAGNIVIGTLGVSISTLVSGSLTVSSINGAAPGGSAPEFSTLTIPGGAGTSTFICNPNITNPLVGFSTVAGHVYSATVYARAQTTEVSADGATVYSEILDNNVGNDPFGNWETQRLSTLTAGGGFQQIGGTVNWKAAGLGAAFNVEPSVSTSVKVDGINIIDFGAI